MRLPSVLAPRLKIFSKLPRSIPPGLRLPSCVPYGVVGIFTAGRFGAPGPIGRSGSRLAFIVAARNTTFASCVECPMLSVVSEASLSSESRLRRTWSITTGKSEDIAEPILDRWMCGAVGEGGG